MSYDVRGAGASTAPRRILSYRLALLAEDLFAVADAVSPDRPVHVVAHDWGSIQAWERIEDVPAADARPASTLASDAVRGMALYRANMLPRVCAPRERSMKVPVQLIQPERDHYVRPQLAEDLERWVPSLRRRSLPVQHWVPLTHPEQVAGGVTEFVTSPVVDR